MRYAAAGCDRWRIKEAKVERHHPWWLKLIGQATARVFRGIDISLRKELKDQILNTYSESNRLLAADIDTNLGRYGYYGGVSGIEVIESELGLHER